MCLDSKTLIYPCTRFRCRIPCPCLLCAKQHSRCNVSSFIACICSDCILHFDDHSVYHATFHFCCKSCSQLITLFPVFNYFFLNTERPKFPYGLTDPIKIKPLVVELEPKNPAENSIKHLMMLKRKEDTWCFRCDARFWSVGQLREHIQLNHLISKVFRHTYENISKLVSIDFQCIQCYKSFTKNSHLVRHVESVHYEETYTCDSCNAPFKLLDSLLRHKKTIHQPPEVEIKTYDCDLCDASFARKDVMIRHKNTAHEISSGSKFSCDDCGKQFNRPDHLRRHVTVHQGVESSEFKCEFCNKAFSRKGNLQRHLLTRIASLCSYCGESFCNMKLLSTHKFDAHLHDIINPEYPNT